jgi:outer membrane protein TolC
MRSPHPGTLLVVVLLQLAFAEAASARQTPRTLTLDEAKQIAWTRNPAVLRAQTDQEIAELQRRQAQNDVLLPAFASSLGFGIGRFRRYTAEDFAGEPLPDPYYAEAVSSRTSQSIGVSMQLFSYGSWLALKSARDDVRRSEQAFDTERHRTGAEVERRFYRVLLADDMVRLEERFTETARERLAAEEARLAAGVSLPSDRLGAEIELLDQETRLERARGEASKARLQLLDVLGLTEDTGVQPVGSVPEAFDPSSLAADSIIARVLRAGPTMEQADLDLESSRLRQRQARAFRWPTVSGSASYSRNRSTSGSDAFWDINPQNRGYDLDLRVSIPIPILRFNEGLSIQAADLGHERTVEDHATTRVSVQRQVRAALIDLNNAWRAIETARRSATLSTERARLAAEQHKYGTITFIELQQINDGDMQAQRALLDARLGFADAVLAVEALLGGPLGQ